MTKNNLDELENSSNKLEVLESEASDLTGYTSGSYSEKSKHTIATKRLNIAYIAIILVITLLAGSLLLLYLLELEDKHFILQTIVYSLFSTLAIIIGFVAGSSIDK